MKKDVILFDGECNLCNGAVNFIIKRDPEDVYRFAALQSDEGKELLEKFEIDPEETDSIVLIRDEKAYIKAAAALRIAKELSGAWPLFYGLRIIPKFIANPIYDFIAKNRYDWFGKKDSCMTPTPELKEKFL